jgi:phage shock protein PspC (stress-responsive transcriptional regulator)
MTDKKLYRIPSKGMIGGVCAGLGDYFDIDPTSIRLVFVLLFFAGFSGGLIYLIMWLIVPIKPADQTYSDDSEDVF